MIYNPGYMYLQIPTENHQRGEELVVIQSDFGSGWTYVQGVHGVGFVPTKILYFVWVSGETTASQAWGSFIYLKRQLKFNLWVALNQLPNIF